MKGWNKVSTRCYIAGAGEFCDREMPEKSDYVIAADGGYAELVKRGAVPDLVVGDFDSLGSIPEHPNVIKIPAEKDDTDILFAVRQGMVRGFCTFIINGGLGGRLDHTLANIQILAYLAGNGARGILLGYDMCATAVTNGSLRFTQCVSGVISVFCVGDKARGVTLTGLKYPLDNAELAYGFPLGVSNEFTGISAEITVRDGTLIVIWQGGTGNLEGETCRE